MDLKPEIAGGGGYANCHSYDLPELTSSGFYVSFDFVYPESEQFGAMVQLYPRDGLHSGPESVMAENFLSIANHECKSGFVSMLLYNLAVRKYLNGSFSYDFDLSLENEMCSNVRGELRLSAVVYKGVNPAYKRMMKSNTIQVYQEVQTYGLMEVASFTWTVFAFASSVLIGLFFKKTAKVPMYFENPFCAPCKAGSKFGEEIN